MKGWPITIFFSSISTSLSTYKEHTNFISDGVDKGFTDSGHHDIGPIQAVQTINSGYPKKYGESNTLIGVFGARG